MKYYLFSMIIALTLFSCKKDEENSIQVETQTTEDPDYFQLEVGNYWVYDIYEVDSSGNEKKIDEQDSIAVIGDTVINNETYYQIGSKEFPSKIFSKKGLWRDSLGNLISYYGGGVYASYTNFTDTILTSEYIDNQDTLYYTFHKMTKPILNTEVPAGSFKVIDCLSTTINTTYASIPIGQLYPRNAHRQYADGIGKVFESFFYLISYKHFEKRLVRYKVN